MTTHAHAGLVVSAPWPVRLFGDLQDVLGLPAIAAAVDLRTVVGVTARQDELYRVTMPGMSGEILLDSARDLREAAAMPALGRVIKGLKGRGVTLRGGYDFQVLTRVPWQARVPDSAALGVAWTATLLEVHGLLRSLSGAETAEYALAAQEGLEPHARRAPEILAATLGGTVLVEPAEKPVGKAIEREIPGLVIGYGHEGDDPQAIPRAVREMLESLLRMRQAWGAFDPRETPTEEVVPRLAGLPEREAGMIYGALVNRDTCRAAHDLIEGEVGFDDDKLAELLDNAHEILRDYFEFNYPQIEKLIAAAMGAGALGSKIAPGFNYFTTISAGRQEDVVNAIREAGGEARPVAISDGIRVQHIEKPHEQGHVHGPECKH